MQYSKILWCGAKKYAGAIAERFSDLYILANSAQGGFYFHPSDETLSSGNPERTSHSAVVVSE
jgi:hypothetical protein